MSLIKMTDKDKHLFTRSFIYFYVYGVFAWMCACLAWYPSRPEEGNGAPGTGIKDNHELTWGCWDQNLGPLKQPPIYL